MVRFRRVQVSGELMPVSLNVNAEKLALSSEWAVSAVSLNIHYRM